MFMAGGMFAIYVIGCLPHLPLYCVLRYCNNIITSSYSFLLWLMRKNSYAYLHLDFYCPAHRQIISHCAQIMKIDFDRLLVNKYD
jgi:flavorubredoxin